MENNKDSLGEVTYYVVVENEDNQYSIWPEGVDLPQGWKELSFKGTKQECLEYINETWIDMRPSSLTKKRSSN